MKEKSFVEFPTFISQKLTEEINSILFDYTSGSQEINEKIFKLLLKVRSEKKLLFLIKLFKINLPSFQIIQTNLSEIEKICEKQDFKKAKDKIRKKLQLNEKRIERIFNQLKKHIKPSIKLLTISNSKTIFDLIKTLKSKNLNPQIYVLESRPGGEGKILYQRLNDLGIRSHLIKDSQINQFIEHIDAVIVGADKIYKDKWFINKIKTKTLLKIARIKKKPAFLIAFKEKVIDTNKIDKCSDVNKTFSALRLDKNLFEKINLNLINEIFIA